jgi:hypothetical protein
MTTAIDKMTQHFRGKLSGELKSITIEEWELTIYFKESITLKEQSKLIELATQGKTTEALVETLITKARNADGTKMFLPTDKVVFMNEVDPAVLIRAVSEINNFNLEDLTPAEIEKN